MKVTLILIALVSMVASSAQAHDYNNRSNVLRQACQRCPVEVEVRPAMPVGTPKAGQLPAPIAAPHSSGLPMGSGETAADSAKFATISPAAQAELQRLGMVAVSKADLDRLFNAVDSYLEVAPRR